MDDPLLPRVQSLLLADHVWIGQGKTYILGSFTNMWFKEFPSRYGPEMWVYGVVDNVRRDVKVDANLHCFEHEKVKCRIQFGFTKLDDPLEAKSFCFPIPPGMLPIEHPGLYAIDLDVEGVTIGSVRFSVNHRP